MKRNDIIPAIAARAENIPCSGDNICKCKSCAREFADWDEANNHICWSTKKNVRNGDKE